MYVYIYIYSGIYSGFGYIADWGYPFVSLLPIHGITDLLSQYHVVWHLPCKACVLGISAVCLALTGSKDKLKEAILGAMKRRNPGVPWPKISLAHVSMAKCCKIEEHHLQMVDSPGPGFGLIGISQHPDAL